MWTYIENSVSKLGKPHKTGCKNSDLKQWGQVAQLSRHLNSLAHRAWIHSAAATRPREHTERIRPIHKVLLDLKLGLSET